MEVPPVSDTVEDCPLFNVQSEQDLTARQILREQLAYHDTVVSANCVVQCPVGVLKRRLGVLSIPPAEQVCQVAGSFLHHPTKASLPGGTLPIAPYKLASSSDSGTEPTSTSNKLPNKNWWEYCRWYCCSFHTSGRANHSSGEKLSSSSDTVSFSDKKLWTAAVGLSAGDTKTQPQVVFFCSFPCVHKLRLRDGTDSLAEEFVEPTATGLGGKPLPATKRRKSGQNE